MKHYDLMTTHQEILKHFETLQEEQSNLCKYIERLTVLQEEYPSLYSYFQLRKYESQEQLDILRYKNDLYPIYLLNIEPSIEEFINHQHKQAISFVRQKNTETSTIEKRIKTIIDITDAYIHLPRNLFRTHEDQNQQCSKCFEVLPQNNICLQCGNEEKNLQAIYNHSDSTRVNITSKFMYAREQHFKECMMQYQGKKQSIDPHVIDHLRARIQQYNMNTTLLSKRDIVMLMKELGYEKKHMGHLNLIHHVITGSPLPDISDLEPILIQEFNILSTLFNRKFIDTGRIARKSFINVSYILFQLLKKNKYPCDEYDFPLLKTIDRKKFCDECCSELFFALKWNFTALF